jgi:hypothetical protein
MGIRLDHLRFLLSARALGFNGKSICTLGKQSVNLKKGALQKLLVEYNIQPFRLPTKSMLWAEHILGPLGYDVSSMDASSYEGATIIHDLNACLPAPAVSPLRGRGDGRAWRAGCGRLRPASGCSTSAPELQTAFLREKPRNSPACPFATYCQEGNQGGMPGQRLNGAANRKHRTAC